MLIYIWFVLNLYHLVYSSLIQYQQYGIWLQAGNEQYPNNCQKFSITNNIELIVYQQKPNVPWRIFLPDGTIHIFIKWYNYILYHKLIHRME